MKRRGDVLGGLLLCRYEWLRARMQLAQVLRPCELSGRVREHRRVQLILQKKKRKKKYTHERNESTVFTFCHFHPLWQGLSLSLTCPLFPSDTLSFSPVFSVSVWHRPFLSSPAPLSLSAAANLSTAVWSCNPFPSFSPVVYFPFYLYNYLSAPSSRRAPCHPSICVYVKYLRLLFFFCFHTPFLIPCPPLSRASWPLHLPPLLFLHPSISPPLISSLLPPARHLFHPSSWSWADWNLNPGFIVGLCSPVICLAHIPHRDHGGGELSGVWASERR